MAECTDCQMEATYTTPGYGGSWNNCNANCGGYDTIETGACAGTCWGYCRWDCGGNCEGGCSDTCSGSCTGSCEGTCSGSCNTACNSTCSGQTQTTNINNLTLNKKFKADDIKNISKAITFEVVNRRNQTIPNEITFEPKELLDDEKIIKLIQNLQQANQDAAYSANSSNKALRVLAEDLIAKIKAANNVTINLPL